MKRFFIVVSQSPTTVALVIGDNKYEYSAPENVIKKFTYLRGRNQGKALSYLKDNCFKSWNLTKESWIFDSIKVGDKVRNVGSAQLCGYVGATILHGGYGFPRVVVYIDKYKTPTWGTGEGIIRIKNERFDSIGYEIPYSNWKEFIEVIHE